MCQFLQRYIVQATNKLPNKNYNYFKRFTENEDYKSTYSDSDVPNNQKIYFLNDFQQIYLSFIK